MVPRSSYITLLIIVIVLLLIYSFERPQKLGIKYPVPKYSSYSIPVDVWQTTTDESTDQEAIVSTQNTSTLQTTQKSTVDNKPSTTLFVSLATSAPEEYTTVNQKTTQATTPSRTKEATTSVTSTIQTKVTPPITYVKPVCPAKPITKNSEKITPRYILNPNKFIIPSLLWGPSNQLLGLKEGIALAIRFNRTLIVPKLYYHYKAPNTERFKYSDELDFSIRYSFRRISQLLSVKYITEIDKLCPDGPDAIWPARDIDLETPRFHIRYIHFFDYYQGFTLTDYAKMNMSGILDINHHYINDYPVPKNLSFWPLRGKVYPVLADEKWESSKWEEVYGESEERCVVRNLPMGTISYYGGRDKKLHISGEEMRDMVAKVTGPPEYVDQIIETIYPTVAKVKREANSIKIPLKISIHWRFDPKDWMVHDGVQTCSLIKFKKGDACDGMNKAIKDPIFFAKAFFHFVTKLSKKLRADSKFINKFSSEGQNITFSPLDVYIASPPSTKDLVDSFKKSMIKIASEYQEVSEIKVNTAKDTIQKYNEKLLNEESCKWVVKEWYEVGSLVEQRLAENVDIFIAAEGSTWSGAVVSQRHAYESENISSKKFSFIKYGNSVLRMLYEYRWNGIKFDLMFRHAFHIFFRPFFFDQVRFLKKLDL